MGSWYYAQAGQQRGPVELAQLQGLLGSGQLGAQDLVWTEGMAQWQPVGQVAALAPAAPAAPPPIATAPIPPAAAPAQGLPVAPYQTYPIYAEPSKYSGLAVTSLVLSLLGVLAFGPLTSIPGAICGHIALKGMRQTGDLRNQGIAQAGFWVGLILSLIYALIIVGIILIFVIAAIGAAASHH